MKKAFIVLVKIYQRCLSPDKGVFVKRRPTCRFLPTCSDYFLQALEKYPWPRALGLGLRRFGRCHPWGGHGYDPLPAPGVSKK